MYDTTKIKEKLQAKNQPTYNAQNPSKDGDQTPDTSPNHLQVMAAIDGSNSPSTPSLDSMGNNVGNGHIKSSNEESDGGKSKNSSPSEGSPSNAKKMELNSGAGNSGNSLEGRNEKADTKRRKSNDSVGAAGFAAAGSTGNQAAKYAPSTAITVIDSGNDTDDNEIKVSILAIGSNCMCNARQNKYGI